MKGLGKMSALLVSGTFLLAGVVSADPDKNYDRGRVVLEQKVRDCSNNRNCRPVGARAERQDNDKDRRSYYNGDRYDNDRGLAGARAERHDREYDPRFYYNDNRHDNDRRSQRDRVYDDRHRPQIELRISTYPTYRNDYRSPSYYAAKRPPYWAPAHGYRSKYYYREYGLSPYPNQFLGYRPEDNRIFWNDERRPQNSRNSQFAQDAEGEYCREYYTEAEVHGRTQQVYGTACEQPDGTWKIKN